MIVSVYTVLQWVFISSTIPYKLFLQYLTCDRKRSKVSIEHFWYIHTPALFAFGFSDDENNQFGYGWKFPLRFMLAQKYCFCNVSDSSNHFFKANP